MWFEGRIQSQLYSLNPVYDVIYLVMKKRSVSMDEAPSLRKLIREIYQIWINEKPNQLAAALAYLGFSLCSSDLSRFRLAGFFINEVTAAERFYTRMEAVLGSDTASFVQDAVSAISAAGEDGSTIISVVSFISLLLAAMGLFLQLKYVLNRIWRVPLILREQKLAPLRQRLLAFLMIIALGLLVILATMINLAFAWFGSIFKDYLGGIDLLAGLNVLALLGVIVLANAFISKCCQM
jgi:membrane protein